MIVYSFDGRDHHLNPGQNNVYEGGAFNVKFDYSFVNGYQRVGYQISSGSINKFRRTGDVINLFCD